MVVAWSFDIVKLRIVTDPTLECKPTPHPDAVAAGTCPSPSSDGLLDDVLGGQPSPSDDGQPTAKTESPSQAPTEPQATTVAPTEPDHAAQLPTTGFSATAGVTIGLLLLVVGAAIIAWTKLRHRRV